MSTDPTAPPDATLPDPALQARMAELLAPLQGHLQALAALLGNAAAAFGGPPAGPIAGTVILDPAILVAPDPLPLLKRPDPAPDAQPIATELRPADLVRDVAALPGPAFGMAAAC